MMGKATRKDCSIPAEEEKQRGGGSIEENKAKQVDSHWWLGSHQEKISFPNLGEIWFPASKFGYFGRMRSKMAKFKPNQANLATFAALARGTCSYFQKSSVRLKSGAGKSWRLSKRSQKVSKSIAESCRKTDDRNCTGLVPFLPDDIQYTVSGLAQMLVPVRPDTSTCIYIPGLSHLLHIYLGVAAYLLRMTRCFGLATRARLVDSGNRVLQSVVRPVWQSSEVPHRRPIKMSLRDAIPPPSFTG
ncbi:hypothetical protein B0H13DRAFT_1922110 [Mycena leptocephala]|nr:hypothetical protein B0H13DRAFT_1922110 [Mycena leptocephala]